MPEVSILVPNYNHGPFLQQRIDSIVQQTFTDFEIIILDDCSTDNSRDIIRLYKNNEKVAHVLLNIENTGNPFLQWKKGMLHAKGKYIWIAESDDFVDRNFLSVALKELKSTNSQLFYCKTVQVDSAGEYLRNLDWWYEELGSERWNHDYTNPAHEEIDKRLIWKNVICNASAVLFEKTNDVNLYLQNIESFRYCGDWLFWLQYLRGCQSICYSVQTTNYWRDHSGTTRAHVSPRRNMEMMKIYDWVASNILKRESLHVLKFYYKVHISKKSRKFMAMHLNFLFDNFKFSRLLPIVMFQFYIRPNRFLF